MPQQLITLGSVDNDHTGEGLREGGVKIQGNFSELYGRVGANVIVASLYPGIDPTGVADSRLGVVSFLTALSNTNIVGIIDCPIYIATGYDNTKTVFVPSNVDLYFTPNGAFILDALGVPALAFIWCINCTWTNYTVVYTANPGATMLAYSGAWSVANGAFNTTTLTNYLRTVNGVTFNNGVTAIWPGPTNSSATHYFGGGSSNIKFLGVCSVTASGATADRFIPCFASFNVQWNPSQTVGSGTVLSNLVASQPTNITFDGWTIDGVCMCFVGTGMGLRFNNIKSLRYGDLEDSAGNNNGGIDGNGKSGALSSGLWFAPPHLFYIQSRDQNWLTSVDYTDILDEGQYTTSNPLYGVRRSEIGGFINSIKVDASSNSTVKNYICKRPDGWADILGQAGGGIGNGAFFDGVDATLDCGVGAFVIVTTATLSAGATSFTVTPANWPCAQSGGGYSGVTSGVYSTTFSNGEVRAVNYTVTVSGNSATAISANFAPGLVSSATATVRMGCFGRFAMRFPNAAMTNVYMANFKFTDTSAFPFNWPILSDSSVGHVNLFLDAEIIVQDWPTVATYAPGFGIAGSGISIKCKTIFNACTSTQNSRGPITNVSSTPTYDHFAEHTLHGWRKVPLTLSAAPSGTSANLVSGNTGVVGWIYNSGTYPVVFSDNQTRAVTFTQGTTACSWVTALTGSPTSVISVLLMNGAQLDNYKPRIQLAATNGLCTGVRARILDVTNGVEIEVQNGLYNESWTQFFYGTLPAGATFTTNINYPAGYAIDRAAWGVYVSIGTVSSISVGFLGGSTSAVMSGLLPSLGSTPRMPMTPVLVTGSVTVTGNVNFDGSGTAALMLRATRTNLSG